MAPATVLGTSGTGSGDESAFEGRLVVAACDKDGGIGINGQLPWPRLQDDMRHFRHVTAGAAVVMGRLTFLSLPPKFRPLPGRLNVILSRDVSITRAQLLGEGNTDNEQERANLLLANSLEAAKQLLTTRGIFVAYVIGGQQAYEDALKDRMWSKKVFLTHVHTAFDCDRFFPVKKIVGEEKDEDNQFECVSVRANLCDNDVKYSIKEYVRMGSNPQNKKLACKDTTGMSMGVSSPSSNLEEMQYLDLVSRILKHGVRRGDRTGTGTISLFGAQMRFSLHDDKFPLLTTKRVFWRGVAEELLWFVRGETNANKLSAKNVHIWDANGSRSFLDGRGFTDREEGDLGPVYGFQWRHFGAEYTNMHADYKRQGVDQLADIIQTLKTNPNDRRMIMSAWNPAATHLMALPPCHLLAQFYVADGRLSCQMYQRSCDMGLGVPFNIASYALLTRLIAEATGLLPGEFVHTLGDAHVYCNHVEALETQLKRTPRAFPTLKIKHRENIEDFTFEDLTIENYEPYGPIAMRMAV